MLWKRQRQSFTHRRVLIMPIRKKDNKTFVRLATKRVNASINSIYMVKRLAGSCDHKPVQVQRIFEALRRHIEDCEKAFVEERKTTVKFNLGEKLDDK